MVGLWTMSLLTAPGIAVAHAAPTTDAPAPTPTPTSAPRPAAPLETAEGFGEATIGGAGGQTYQVTTLEDSGPGSLREGAEQPGPRIITFDVQGEIRLDSPIFVTSETTIDGLGADITITNAGFELMGVEQVIVRDLAFTRLRGETVDAITIRDGSQHVWITHCAFSDGQDGLVDVVQNATDVTISWSLFTDHDKTMLLGNQQVPDEPHRVTVHHNYFLSTNARNPRVKDALVHAYNNVLRDWTGHGMWARENSMLFSEGNVFDAGPQLEGIRTSIVTGASVRSTGDVLLGGATVTESLPGMVTDPNTLYRTPVAVEEAGPALIESVTQQVGPRLVGPALISTPVDDATAVGGETETLQTPGQDSPTATEEQTTADVDRRVQLVQYVMLGVLALGLLVFLGGRTSRFLRRIFDGWGR